MKGEIQVAVVMGSESDRETMQACVEELGRLHIACELRVSSAHRQPKATVEYVEEALARGVQVFVAGAGMAAALPGYIASLTTRPVIGVPLASGLPGGIDALYAIAQMPPGVPVATVAVGAPGARNAAILAAEILALSDDRIAEALQEMRNRWHRS